PMAPRPRKATCAGPVSMPNSPPCRVEIYDTAPRAFPRGAASVRTVWAAALPRRRPVPLAGAGRPGCRLAGQPLKHLLQVLLAAEAHVLLLGLAVAEDDQRGNAHDAVALGDVGALVDVELGELDLVAVLAGQFLEDRRHHAARAAPRGPEVDDHRLLRLQDFLLERGAGDFGDLRHGNASQRQ